jgi:sulfotransferase family protein
MTRVVYIMGHGYSGSTLLTFLLSTHPQIATIGELGIAPHAKEEFGRPEEYFCSCRTPVRQCGFWQRVSQEMGERGHDFDVWDADLDFRVRGGGIADLLLRAVQRGPVLETARDLGLRIVPDARRERDRVVSRIGSLAEIVARIKGCDVFLDSSKRPERATLMQRSGSFDLRVIHLVRDGRAVSWSSMKHLKIGPEEAARSWLADNQGSEHARRYFPADRWMSLRYEDLCADPDGTLRRIHAFAGIPSRNGFHNFRAVDHHIIGNNMRLSSTSEIRLDESWKQALTPEQMTLIDRLVAPLNRRYGYGPL